jgi:uncharacterized membrane protein
MHYNSELVVDRYGSKVELLILCIVLFSISMLISVLLHNLHHIDPKQSAQQLSSSLRRISWIIVVFMAMVGMFIIHQTIQFSETGTFAGSLKYLLILVPLLFAALGYFMPQLKPNYMIGVRTPWTMKDPENWRLTHRLSSGLWMAGGLLMAVLIILSPMSWSVGIILVGVILLSIIPIIYSFRIHQQQRHTSK